MRRLFISIDLPKNIQHELDYEVSELQKSAWDKVKFVPKENWHLTLIFLGDQDDIAMGQIISALNTHVPQIKAQELLIKSLCYGPKIENPSMIWALTDKESSLKLLKIRDSINNTLAKANVRFQEDKRTYNGHITLARLKSRNSLPALSKNLNIKFTAYTISLIESELTKNEAEYITLASWTLNEE